MKFLARILVALALLNAQLASVLADTPSLNGQYPLIGSTFNEIKTDTNLEYGELYKRGTIRSVTVTNPVSVNAIVLASANVPVTALSDGITVEGIGNADNTTATTVALDSTSATTLRDMDGNALVGGEIKNGRQFRLRYSASASQWRIVSGSEPLTAVAGMGTGVRNALAVNVGTAGSPVVNGGALGTPSSGVATNLTSIPAGNLTGTGPCSAEPALTGDVTSSAGSCATTIANSAVTLGKMANETANTILGNNTGSLAAPIALTAAQVKTLLAIVRADVTDWGTGIQAALGVNVGTAGSPVINGGVLGTPSSGTGTNITGIKADTNLINAVPIANGGTSQTTAQLARSVSGLNIDEATTKGDTAYTIVAADRSVITTTTFTASRTWTLPAASALNAGQHLIIADMAGAINGANTLVIARAGADTINGVTSVTLSAQYNYLDLVSDGTSKWTYAASAGGGSGTMGSVTITAGTNVTTSGTCSSTTAISCTVNASGLALVGNTATTSGTAPTQTGIPSTATQVTVVLNAVSSNGTGNYQIRLGSGSLTASGYVAFANQFTTAAAGGTTSITAGFQVFSTTVTSSESVSGNCTFNKITGVNTWIGSCVWMSTAGTALQGITSGTVTLGGALDRIGITTAAGTDTFDAGSLQVMAQ